MSCAYMHETGYTYETMNLFPLDGSQSRADPFRMGKHCSDMAVDQRE